MKFGWTLFVGTVVLLSGTEIRAEELPVYTLDAVTVTATRTEQVPEVVPPAVQAIDREKIAGSGAGNIRDVLAAETNMILTSSRFGGHNLILRGMDTDKSLILINGRRVANEASAAGLGNAMALDRINLFNVDRIEIASGPASALYGSDAMGGVINIITRTPEKPEVTVGLEAGSETTANWWHADTGRIGNFLLPLMPGLINTGGICSPLMIWDMAMIHPRTTTQRFNMSWMRTAGFVPGRTISASI